MIADPQRAEELLREAKKFKGESLGREAIRRLSRNRAAWWSLLFLCGLAIVSLLAPLWPLPSPAHDDRSRSLDRPVVPWSQWGSEEWAHRTVLRWTGPVDSSESVGSEATLERLEKRVGEATQRATSGRTVDSLGSSEYQVAVPFRPEDVADEAWIERIKNIGRTGDLSELEWLGVRPEDAYWPMSGFDRWLTDRRASLFGFWQTGPWFGTDVQGRDLLSRIVWGSRTSIMVAIAATLCSLLIGVTYGAVSGLWGGRVDRVMMRIVDVLYSIPFIFVVIFLVTMVGEYRTELEEGFGITREVIFFVVIGAIYWLTMARVVRGQVLALRHSEFIDAARVIGASRRRILFAHLIPNVLSIVVVYLTLTIPAVMLFEAFLTYLGLGIEAPKVSWGLLAVEGIEGVSPLDNYWWLVLGPAAAMASTLLALNILGDGLRDALDPRMRGGGRR